MRQILIFYESAVIEDAIQQKLIKWEHLYNAWLLLMTFHDCKSTSSSAALDESIYNGGNCDRLVVVSAEILRPQK